MHELSLVVRSVLASVHFDSLLLFLFRNEDVEIDAAVFADAEVDAEVDADAEVDVIATDWP